MRRWAVTMAMAAVLMGGCGGEQGAVEQAVEDFAAAAEDPKRTCGLVTRESQAELQRLGRLTGGRSCADAVELIDAEAGQVSLEDVKIDGDRATVQETLTATEFTLRREGGKWRVDVLALDQLGWTLRQSIACSEFVAEVESLGEPESRREFAAYLADYERLAETWAQEAEQVEPSRMYRSRHEDLMRSIADIRRATGVIRTALRKGDQAGADRGLQALERAESGLDGQPLSCGPQTS